MIKLLALAMLEYDITWKGRAVLVAYVSMIAAYLGVLRSTSYVFSKPSSDLHYVLEAASFYPLMVFMLISCYAYSKSFAEQLSKGLIKGLLVYPINRSELFAAKVLSCYALILSTLLFPALYSLIALGVDARALIAVILAYAVRLYVYASIAVLASLIAIEPLPAFVCSLLTALAVEALPSFARALGAEQLWRILSVNQMALALAEVLLFDSARYEIDMVAGAIYAIVASLFIAISRKLFEKMDLD